MEPHRAFIITGIAAIALSSVLVAFQYKDKFFNNNASAPISMTLEGSTLDVVPPIGQLVVDNEFVTSTQVSLGLAVTDPEQPSDNPLEYRLRLNDGPWSEWRPVVPAVTLTLLPNGEINYVFAEFRDAAGNVSRRNSANLVVDQVPPDTAILDGSSQGKVEPDVKFMWVGTDDNIIGDAGYYYSYMLEGYDAAWTEFSRDVYEAVYTGLPLGNYVFKVRTRDYAGNIDPTPASVSIEVVEM